MSRVLKKKKIRIYEFFTWLFTFTHTIYNHLVDATKIFNLSLNLYIQEQYRKQKLVKWKCDYVLDSLKIILESSYTREIWREERKKGEERERERDGSERRRGKWRGVGKWEGASPLTKCKSGPTANQVRQERPAVSSRDVTQVPAGGVEGVGGQCS